MGVFTTQYTTRSRVLISARTIVSARQPLSTAKELAPEPRNNTNATRTLKGIRPKIVYQAGGELIGKGRRFAAGAQWLRPRIARRVRLEGVDQVKLQAVEPRFLCAGTRHQHARPRFFRDGHARSQNGVLEVRIQSAAVPPGERRGGVGSNPPQTVEAMLHNVGRRALIALTPGCNRCVLLFPLERISELDVALLFLLAKADVRHV